METRFTKRFALLAGFSVSLLTIGCSSKPPVAEKAEAPVTAEKLTVVEGPAPTDEEKASLLAAKDALFSKLSGRLMDTMATSGPAAAIQVCAAEAKVIAAEVGDAAKVKIGRTGVRLRSPANQPPHWAQELVNQKTDSPQFVRLSNQQAGALLPIKLQAQCLKCHGPTEALAPGVPAMLAKLYPDDQATGFSDGELRGWFWIESLQ